MSYWAAVAAIQAANLRPNTYRTARELLDLAAETGQVKISKSALLDLCQTAADGTMRRQLGELAKAGIIHFSTNDAVHISFTDYPTVDGTITTRAPAITTRAPMITTRAQQTDEDADSDPAAAADDASAITTRASTITTRAPAITSCAPPHTRGVCLFVSSSDPDPLQGKNEQTNKHPRTSRRKPPPPALTEQQQRALNLLTDPDVGLNHDLARRFAAEFEFDYLARQTFEWRRQLDAGVAQSAGALVTRIREGFGAVIIDADRASPLWQRHMPHDDRDASGTTEEDRRRKYIPDEFADIILG